MQFLEDAGGDGDIDVDNPIDDVMATLAALSKASGVVKIDEADGDMSTEVQWHSLVLLRCHHLGVCLCGAQRG